jgi:hypothetical protein
MSDSMSVQEQLDYERSVSLRYALIAAAAAVLIMAAATVQLTGVHAKVQELTISLITAHKRGSRDLIGAVISAFGFVALAVTLNYLYSISKARKEDLQPYFRWMAIVGATLSAITVVIYTIVFASKASDFVNHGPQTYDQANVLTGNGLLVILPLFAELASLGLTVGFVWVSLNAMRVGLLTKFLGYLGVFAGVLVLIPIGPPATLVQGFWLLAIAYLVSGRWPQGMPASWTTGKIEPWPTSAELREQREQRAGSKPGASKAGASKPKPAVAKAKPAWTRAMGKAKEPEPEPEPEPEVGSGTPARTRASTPKRKRKRRH